MPAPLFQARITIQDLRLEAQRGNLFYHFLGRPHYLLFTLSCKIDVGLT